MNKKTLAFVSSALVACGASAQTVVDALQLSRQETRGTARFMSMGGAFTALGGDISAIGQNPAAVGIYRSSEIGATLDIDINKSQGPNMPGQSHTTVNCNNFGYVGSATLNNDVFCSFNWSVTYNRLANFDRHSSGYLNPTGNSLSNYIASFTDLPADAYHETTDYNPYQDSYIYDGQEYYPDWLSVLGAESHLINRVNGRWQGLNQNGTIGDAEIYVDEKGYNDEYLFNFGGNLANVVYWGVGIGVGDLKYTRSVNYSESLQDANVYNGNTGRTSTGNAGFWLDNYKRITGTGVNFSFGLIVKPINELRFGASIKSPTYWKLQHGYDAAIDYSYFVESSPSSNVNPYEGNTYTDWADFDWKLRSPWRFNFGVAGVISNKAIVSVDYERTAYNDMNIKNAWYDNWGYLGGYDNNEYANNSVKTVAQSANTLRLGAEYRVTPSFSVRAGYNYTSSNVKSEVADGNVEMPTSGTDPSYSVDKARNAVSLGLGYRIRSFYIDAAYVYTKRDATLSPYTSYQAGSAMINEAPRMDISSHSNALVFSVGLKF